MPKQFNLVLVLLCLIFLNAPHLPAEIHPKPLTEILTNAIFQCGTCDYLSEQAHRIHQGKKPIVDPNLVPEDYFDYSNPFTSQNVNDWPRRYIQIAPDRTDSNNNGLLECRVKIDYSGFLNFGYSQALIDDIVEEQRYCLDIYNEALKHVGLEFIEVTNDSYHVLFQVSTDPIQTGFTGIATMHGAFGVERTSPNNITFVLNGNTNFQAMYQRFENGSLSTLFDQLPGDPFSSLYHPSNAIIDGTFRQWVGGTMLHEMGHLLGLEHPWTALQNYQNNIGYGYPIDWLSHPIISNPPPDQFSWTVGGEDFAATNWSRGLYNTFMTYDRPLFTIQFDLPPQIKAFIAHYYGIFNPDSAQVLLDQAINEYQALSPLARGELNIESEPNNNTSTANPIVIGQPIIGALSSRSDSLSGFIETFQDTNDSYLFEISEADIGRSIHASLEIASIYYENFFTFSRDGRQVHGDVAIQIYDPSNTLLLESPSEEFPQLTFTPTSAGQYSLSIVPASDSNYLVHKDYLLQTSFADGGLPSVPTWTPTPTSTPIMVQTNPTPIVIQKDYDLAIERVWLADESGIEISNPLPSQLIRLYATIKNIGKLPADSFQFDYYINGIRIGGNLINQPTLPGGTWTVWSGYRTLLDGIFDYEFRVTFDSDQDTRNNTYNLLFPVGGAILPTNTPLIPTSTPTPSATPTPVQTGIDDWRSWD